MFCFIFVCYWLLLFVFGLFSAVVFLVGFVCRLSVCLFVVLGEDFLYEI